MEDKNNIDPRKIQNLPTELQWDSMESKIVDKMDELEKDDSRRRLFFLLFFFGVIAAATWMLWPTFDSSIELETSSAVDVSSHNNEEVSSVTDSYERGGGADENTKPKPRTTTTNSDLIAIPTSDQIDDKNDLDGISDAKIAQVQLSGDADKHVRIASKTSRSTTLTDRNTSRPTNSSEAYSRENTPMIVDALTVGSDASSKSDVAKGPSDKSTISDRLSADGKSTMQSEGDWVTVNTLASTVSYLPINKRSVTLPRSTLYENTIKDEAKSIATHQFSLLAGIALWGPGYGAVLPERAAFENSIPSFATQLNYTYTVPSRWTLTTGVQYQRLESEFNYTKQLEDVPVTLFDTIILIQQNAISGNQNLVRGDVDLLTDGQRRVRHFNRTELFQVPIAIGYSWETGLWTTNVGGGTAFNLMTTHTGKTIMNGDITEYGNADNDMLSTSFGVNGLLYGTVTYRIRQRWGITASTSFQKSISNWSTEPDISMKPTILNFALGLSYKL